MTVERICGECMVCCEVPEIPGFIAAHEPCRYQRRSPSGSCSVFGGPERHRVCEAFTCAWVNGVGSDDDRPDKIGAMFSINQTAPGKVIGFVGEQVEGALAGPAKEMAIDFARRLPLPLVVVPYGTDGSGEFIILQDDLREPAAAMLGREVARLADDVAMYERVTPRG